MKNHIVFVLIILMLPSLTLFSQSQCQCEEALTNLKSTVEKEYIGFKSKIEKKGGYAEFAALLKQKSKDKNANCFEILRSFIKYMDDGHVHIIQVKGNKKITPDIELSEEELRSHLAQSSDPIEGVWVNNNYRIGIFKKGHSYYGFILSTSNSDWKANEVKFILQNETTGRYFRSPSFFTDQKYFLHENKYLYFDYTEVSFSKEDAVLSQKDRTNINEKIGFIAYSLSDKTAYIKFPSFDYAHVERVKKLVENFKSTLSSHDYLIVDLRENLGGTDYTFQPITPYIFGKTIRFITAEVLASETRINAQKRWIETADEHGNDVSNSKVLLKNMLANRGKYIPINEDVKAGNFGMDTITTNPKHVVFLVNSNTASSAENLLLSARQSKKVKIMGVPTAGGIDLTNAFEFTFGCDAYKLFLPTQRSGRLPVFPIDNIGMQPDVYLDQYVEDWIEYAKEYLEK